MSMSRNVARWGGLRLSRRLSRSIPFVGALVAFGTLGYAIRRKGWLGGTLDTGLNAVPFVGALKTAVEVARGRDIIADRRHVAQSR
jgi:hypothetical protein